MYMHISSKTVVFRFKTKIYKIDSIIMASILRQKKSSYQVFVPMTNSDTPRKSYDINCHLKMVTGNIRLKIYLK